MSTTCEDTKLPIPAKGSLAGREKISAWPKAVFVETGLVKAYQAGNPAADTQREMAISPALMAAGFMLARKSARAHLLPLKLLPAAGSGAPGVFRAQPRYLNSAGPGRLAAGRQGRPRDRRPSDCAPPAEGKPGL